MLCVNLDQASVCDESGLRICNILGKYISVKLSFEFLFSTNHATSQINKIKGQCTDSMFCVPSNDSESNMKKLNNNFFT